MKTFSSTPIALALALAALALSPSQTCAQDAPAACETILEAYAQVEQLYERGDYEAAAALLQAAAALCPQEPMLHYNLGRTLERRSQQLREGGEAAAARTRTERAIEAYDAFLHAGQGEASVLTRAQTRRDALAASLSTEAAITTATPPAVNANHAEISPWPWVVAGIGVAALGAGVGLGVHALDRNTAADRAPSQAQTFALLPEAQDFATAANVTMVAGGVVALAGAIWGIIDVVSSGGNAEHASNPFVLHF